VAREINRVSSSGDVVLLLTPNGDGNRMSGTICGMDSTDGTQRRSGTLKLDVIVNTNSQIGGPNPSTQETFSFIKHAIINAPSIYTPVTCDYNGKNWFAIRIQGDALEDPWYSWFSGLLQHTGGDDTLSIVSNDGVNVTNVVDFTRKEDVQHTEFSHQDVIVSGGNIGIGTNTPIAKLDVRGDIYSPGVICQTQQYEYSSTGVIFVTSGTTTLLSCPFTPKFSNSKILVQLSIPVQTNSVSFNIFVNRNTSRITSNPGGSGIVSYSSGTDLAGHLIHTGVGYDVPNTTSQITYDIVAEYVSGDVLTILTQTNKLIVFIHELCQ